MKTKLFVLALLWAATTNAGEPRICVNYPKAVPVGSQIVLDARESTGDADDSIQWQVVLPQSLPIKVETADKNGKKDVIAYFSTTKPGFYQIAVTVTGTVDGKKKSVTQNAVIEVVGQATPEPQPQPQPSPTPGPTPQPQPVYTDQQLWMTGVFDQQQMAPDLALFLVGAKIRSVVASDGKIRYYVFYSNNPELDKKGLRNYIAGAQLPAFIFQDSTGKVINVLRATTEDEVVQTILKLRGR